MNKDLKWIKNNYSESLEQLCRKLFPNLLKRQGLLPELLDKSFAHSAFLYDDIVKQNSVLGFKKYICSLIGPEEYNFSIYGYVKANDGKFYKFNYKVDNVYCCPNSIIIDNLEPSKLNFDQMLLDTCILDLTNKTIKPYISMSQDKEENNDADAFADSINSYGKIVKINKYRDKANNIVVELYINENLEPIIVKVNEKGIITGYINNYVEHIKDNFFINKGYIKEIVLNNCRSIGDNCISSTGSLEVLSLPLVETIGSNFMLYNGTLKKLKLPSVVSMGDNCVREDYALKEVNMPNIKNLGQQFLGWSPNIEKLVISDLVDAEYLKQRFADKIIYVTNENNTAKVKKMGEYN